MRGREAIRRYWSETEVPDEQKAFSFGSEVLSLEGDRAIAHWWTSYTKRATGKPMRLDGVFVLEFADDGRCRSLREWWHADPATS